MKILLFAYACEPHKGSEPGAGWIWARMLAGFGETWVVTRANNAESIQAALPLAPERERMRFIYVDLPRWARFWKRGSRGVILYYLLWQLAALRRARRLHRKEGFRIAWHYTLANIWIGSFASFVGAPTFIYGPVGGGPGPPWKLLSALGVRGSVSEITRSLIRSTARFLSPLARVCWSRADLILVPNPETRARVPRKHRLRTVVFPDAIVDALPLDVIKPRRNPPTALFACRLIPSKGGALVIEALRFLPEWRLVICGEGPDETRLRRLARRAGVDQRIDFRGWVTRADVQRVMREEADIFLFPTLRDPSPVVVPEAMLAGLPVVCLDWGGPPLYGAVAVPVGGRAETARALAEAVQAAYGSRAPRVPSFSEHRERLANVLRERGFQLEIQANRR